MEVPPPAQTPDLRLAAVGAAAWAGTLLGLGILGAPNRIAAAVGALALGSVVGVVATVLLVRRRAAGSGLTPLRAAVLLWLCVFAVQAGLAGVRAQVTTGGAVADLAQRRAAMSGIARVTSDPVVRPGAYAEVLIYRVTVTRVSRPAQVVLRSPVLVMTDPAGERPTWGSTVELSGRLAPSRDRDLAGVLMAHRAEVVAEPAMVHRAAGRVRASIRGAAGGPSPGDDLVPALVDGDDAHLPETVVSDFRTAGLTHLTAVSGANLTILLAVLLPLARWCRVRGRGVLVVAAVGVVGFVLVTRPEPSVLRAAVMGCVALVGLGAGGRGAGLRALGFAVLGLLMVSPHLATSWGFALSVTATAGILLLGPGLSRALSWHLPRPVADAVAVPIAAQLACTPLVAALTDQVSVVAVLANLVAAPLVAPTTVLGLAAGLLGLLWPPLGWGPGEAAGWCGYGIVLVARHGAALPGASVPWAGQGWALVVLCTMCLAVAGLARPLARRRGAVVAVVLGLGVALLLPGTLVGSRLVPGASWPPPAWLVAMCDVGQGDALVLRSAPKSAVVIDAGPVPSTVDRCLDRLGVAQIPSLVLTHFHQDHVGGLSGALEGRRVAEIQVSPLDSPGDGAALVRRTADRAGVPVRVPRVGEVAQVGAVRWQVIGPMSAETDPNDASLVLLADVGGVRLLLSGDAEPTAQGLMADRWDIEGVDVVKVPHHGSRFQDAAWLRGLGADVALVSAGRDNDYGHPAPETVTLFEQAGATLWRTDRDGDVALVMTADGLGVALG